MKTTKQNEPTRTGSADAARGLQLGRQAAQEIKKGAGGWRKPLKRLNSAKEIKGLPRLKFGWALLDEAGFGWVWTTTIKEKRDHARLRREPWRRRRAARSVEPGRRSRCSSASISIWSSGATAQARPKAPPRRAGTRRSAQRGDLACERRRRVVRGEPSLRTHPSSGPSSPKPASSLAPSPAAGRVRRARRSRRPARRDDRGHRAPSDRPGAAVPCYDPPLLDARAHRRRGRRGFWTEQARRCVGPALCGGSGVSVLAHGFGLAPGSRGRWSRSPRTRWSARDLLASTGICCAVSWQPL